MGVLLEEDRGAIRVLTLNRPHSRNALNTELLRALEDGFSAAESADGVEVIVLTGTDPAFCGGVDLRELEERGRAPEMGQPLTGVTKPVIGAVNGPAITGGLELALMCDLLVASELAVFADTHGRLGLLPGWGQMARLPNAVGNRRATDLLLTSRTCDAAEALEFGLVNAVVPHAETLPTALSMAAAIGESDQPAVRAMLAQLREGASDQMAAALARERERADLWQGQGFDTDRVSRTRDSLR